MRKLDVSILEATGIVTQQFVCLLEESPPVSPDPAHNAEAVKCEGNVGEVDQ